MQYNLVRREDSANITVVIDGDMHVADDNHPQFEEIVSVVESIRQDEGVYTEQDLVDLFDASRKAAARFENLSERVTVANSRIYVDGDEVDDVYADQIIRFMDEGVDDWKPLVNFLEKVYTNVEAHTRENLSRWLRSVGSFTIADNGNIIGYKGLTRDRTSIHAGPGIVDGVAQNGHLPNNDGSVVEIARSKVTADPSVGCASGLHVGTWDYASGFGQVVVEVEVNPRDVVSVPTDCGGQKMRVARYRVVRALDSAYNTAVVPSGWAPAEDYDDEYDDYDEDDYNDWGF